MLNLSLFTFVVSICLLLGTTVFSRGPKKNENHRERFDEASSDDLSSSDNSNNDDRNNNNINGNAPLPDFVRVEIEIQRLENPGGILSNNKKCDFFKACDPRVYALLDTDKPLSPWSVSSSAAAKWPVIFEASNTNSPTIGKSVNQDICGGALSEVNLRVHVVDVDSLTANDDLINFNCLFAIDVRDIAKNAGSASWGPSTSCEATPANSKIRLFTRMRVYQIPASDCRADGSLSTQPVDDRGRLRDGTATFQIVTGHTPGQHDYIRLDVELVQLLNPQGVAATGKSCDTTGACDPLITAYLDADKPLAAWPGPKTIPQFTTIFKASNVNSPIINKNISKNICGGSVNKLNLRAHVVDRDTVSHNDFIGDFQCLFAANYRQIALDISSSDWTPTQDCAAINQKNDIRLQYRYRIYDISPSDCGIKTTANN